jgi:hypothetical protein
MGYQRISRPVTFNTEYREQSWKLGQTAGRLCPLGSRAVRRLFPLPEDGVDIKINVKLASCLVN